ncbi:MAG: CmpA/NrtA family ABC transporter substrate-binding protein [Proteobacteria bacterium]|nr:CmpA/NrtA family ABC transporter substrate-binding protein [Pseudomonadota bacterium]MDA1021841.1 CmpA/NrtA family ABC transporter substrate-binding protein [Pseudomonadota bacterium]
MGTYSNPFDPDKKLWGGCSCGKHKSAHEHEQAMAAEKPQAEATQVRDAAGIADTPSPAPAAEEPDGSNMDETLARCVESAVMKGIFGTDVNRRRFLGAVGSSTALAAVSQFFPLDAAMAAVTEMKGKLEKTKLNVGFVPITCATPIIMAKPLGFYKKYGLDVDVIKTAGWAVSRDKSLSGEYDAAHMLTPMPLSISMGAGSTKTPWTMPAVENVNGQAITLAMKHKDKRDPKMWKGFKFAVPFEYSMHNFLLRYYVAEHGLDPDKDIQIRVLPPPEMVANLRAGNVDGYLSPDPFNQRAVYDGVGFIHLLTKDIWDKHPCCAFAASRSFIDENPNTFLALFKSVIDATTYASERGNRKEIAKAIAPKNYLNQPVTVVEQVLTGVYADGLGNVKNVPDRIDFDPFPWHSMGVWIMTQMKRWGYVKGDIDYKKVAEEVYLATDAQKVMAEMGLPVPSSTYEKYTIMGKTFDPDEPEAYAKSFAITRV